MTLIWLCEEHCFSTEWSTSSSCVHLLSFPFLSQEMILSQDIAHYSKILDSWFFLKSLDYFCYSEEMHEKWDASLSLWSLLFWEPLGKWCLSLEVSITNSCYQFQNCDFSSLMNCFVFFRLEFPKCSISSNWYSF